jgi:hypothetical protein
MERRRFRQRHPGPQDQQRCRPRSTTLVATPYRQGWVENHVVALDADRDTAKLTYPQIEKKRLFPNVCENCAVFSMGYSCMIASFEGSERRFEDHLWPVSSGNSASGS